MIIIYGRDHRDALLMRKITFYDDMYSIIQVNAPDPLVEFLYLIDLILCS